MAEKFAIYAGPPLAAALVGFEHCRSARVNQIAAEHEQFVSELSPTLTELEWQALTDALLSTWIDDEATLKYAWADVAEADGLGEKWGLDQAALAQKIKALTQSELLATREVLRRYRELMGAHAPAQALAQAGAKVSRD